MKMSEALNQPNLGGLLLMNINTGSRSGRADSVMDSHTTGRRFKTVLSTELQTDYHPNSIKLSVC